MAPSRSDRTGPIRLGHAEGDGFTSDASVARGVGHGEVGCVLPGGETVLNLFPLPGTIKYINEHVRRLLCTRVQIKPSELLHFPQQPTGPWFCLSLFRGKCHQQLPTNGTFSETSEPETSHGMTEQEGKGRPHLVIPHTYTVYSFFWSLLPPTFSVGINLQLQLHVST